MLNVFIDCEKLRNPNTGFAETCIELSKALQHYENEELHFHFALSSQAVVPKEFVGKNVFTLPHWRKESYIKYFRPLLSPCYNNAPKCVWHVTTQMAKYLPLNPHVPKILTINDLNILHLKTPKIAAKKLKKIRYLAQQSDYITTISHYVAREVRQYLNVGEKPLKVIYLAGSNFNNIAPQAPKNCTATPFLFTISSLEARKNIHVLIPFLEKIKTYSLMIAGQGKASYIQEMKKLLVKYKLQHRVIFTGPVSQNERYWLYQHCTAFLFPSLAEGFAIPVLDALKFAKPIFLSDKTCLPEIAGDNAWYWKNFDPEYMREVFILGMKDYEKEKETYQKKMRQRAQQFSWDKTAREYIQIYKSLQRSS